MSVESSAIVWHHSAAPTPTAKLIMLKIADMDGDGGAWPSMKTLAKAGQCTEDAARRIVRKLETLGELRTRINAGGGLRTQRHMRTNVYELLLSCPWYCDHTREHRDLRDPKNELFRPPHWDVLVDANDPPTPGSPPDPPVGGPPIPRSGEPSLNQTPIETSSVNDEYLDAQARENEPQDDYSNFHPGQAVAAAQRAAAEAAAHPGGIITDEERERYRELVDGPREAPPPPRPQPRPPAVQARVDELEAESCPAAPGFNHWIPTGLDGCVRGCDTTITPQKANAA